MIQNYIITVSQGLMWKTLLYGSPTVSMGSSFAEAEHYILKTALH